MREIVEPTLAGMAAEGAPFRGVLFVGLMIDAGVPRVLEYNVRFGDPEATVLVPTYGGDWFELLDAAARGDLSARCRRAPRERRCALRRDGGGGISRASRARRPHRRARRAAPAGRLRLPRRDERAAPTARSSRAAAACSRSARSAATLEDAARLAYEAVARIHWDGEHHRRDIGRRALPNRRGRRLERTTARGPPWPTSPRSPRSATTSPA